MANNSRTESICVQCRIMYPAVHQPRKSPLEDEPSYKVDIVIPANDPQYQMLQGHVQKLMAEVFPNQQVKHPFKDESAKNPKLQGHIVIKAKSAFQPNVVDMNRQPIANANVPSDGDYCYVYLHFYSWQTSGGGISAGLEGLIFVQEGEKLGTGSGGQISTDAMFAQLPGNVPPPQQPAQQVQPAQQPAQQVQPQQINPNPFG